MNREAIYSALFNKLIAVPGFVDKSRRLKHWADVPAVNQPAIYQSQIRETALPGDPRGLPTKWNLSVDVHVYVHSNSSPDPVATMNTLLDAIQTGLAPSNPMERTQTLGGLVEHCWIEGDIETDQGLLGDQSVAIIPIRILVS